MVRGCQYQESHVQPVYGNTMERMVNVRELIRVADAFETIQEVLEATMSTSLDVEIDEEKNAVSMIKCVIDIYNFIYK